MKFIHVKGAKQHNLKNIDLDIPRDKLTVITGLSGSGKSSLAFDTLYAEGQRRYVESLSAYARQFLSVMDKPEVDTIEGLSPAISIEQKSTSHNPRSTVGTVTEIYDYLRLLYARSGTAKCLDHNISLEGQTIDQIGKKILKTKLEAWKNLDPTEFCNEKMYRGWKRNEQLVDLAHTPEDIKQKIVDQYDTYEYNQRDKLLNYFVKNKLRNLTEHIGDF